MIYDNQCSSDGVDKIDTCQLRGATVRGKGEECAAEDTGYAAEDEPGPAVGRVADAVADDKSAGNGDKTGRGVEEGRVRGREAECSDQSCGVCCHYTA